MAASDRKKRRDQRRIKRPPQGGGGPLEFGRDLARNAGELVEGAFPETRRQFNEQGEEIREAAAHIPHTARSVANAESAEDVGRNIRRTLGEVGTTAFEVGANAVQTAGALARDVTAPIMPIVRGARGFLGALPNEANAANPPRPPEGEPGAVQTDGTPGSEQTASPLEEPPPVIAPVTDRQTPVSLANVSPDGSREISRPPSSDLPEGSVRLHMGGANNTFIQDPSGVRFRELPGKTIEESREAAALRSPGEQFRQQQVIAQQGADSARINAEANAQNAQSNTAIIGYTADGSLRQFFRGDDGNFQEVAGITPQVDAIVNGPVEYDIIDDVDPATQLPVKVAVNPQDPNDRIPITKAMAKEAAIEQMNKLIRNGDDPEDAREEVENDFNVVLTLQQ
jgi:hypothetical protein